MPMPVWKKEYTAIRAEKLDNLDIPVSENASPAEVRSEVSAELDSRGATSTRFANLDNLDKAISAVDTEVDESLNKAIPDSPTADSIFERIKTLDDNYTSDRAAKLDNLDAAVSSRATPTDVRNEIDAEFTERGATSARFAKLDNLDKAISDVDTEVDESLNRAIPDSPTADSIFERIKTLDDNYTSARAAKLDNLDASVSSRATPSDVDTQVHNRLNTAIPDSPNADSIYERIKALDDNYTSARAAKLDNLDVAVSSRATPSDVNAQVDSVLNTAIPASPTADSIYERIKTLDDNYTSARASKLDNLDATVSSRATPSDVDTQVHNRLNTAIPDSPNADSIYERIKTLDDNYTSARAAKLDNLDVAVSSRAAPGDILVDPSTDKIDGSLIDAAISSRATPSDVDAKVDSRLNTAIPASPTADSIYERIKALDDNYTAARAAKLDNLDYLTKKPFAVFSSGDVEKLDDLSGDLAPTASNGNIIDNDTSTYVSLSAGDSVTVTFKVPVIVLAFRAFAAIEMNVKIEIQRLDDTWVTIWDSLNICGGNVWSDWAWTENYVVGNVVRITVNSVSDTSSALKEIEIYGVLALE